MLVDKRKSKFPFDQNIADKLCELIARGGRITKICNTCTFPTYNVICRWRRESAEFNDDVVQAYRIREFDLEIEIQELAYRTGVLLKRNPNSTRMLRSFLNRSIGVRYPSQLRPKIDNRRLKLIINTGISVISLRALRKK